MAGPSETQLKEWVTDLESELSALESQITPLLERRDQLKRQMQAIQMAILKNANSEPTSPPSQRVVAPSPQQPRGPRPRFTPVITYWKPTLEALADLGGSAKRDIVVQLVGEKLSGILTEVDKQMLPSGGQIRWENRVAFQRENMKRQGLIRGDSPRGIWEITEEGRRWLKDASERSSDSIAPTPNRNGTFEDSGGSRRSEDEKLAKLLGLTIEQAKALRARAAEIKS